MLVYEVSMSDTWTRLQSEVSMLHSLQVWHKLEEVQVLSENKKVETHYKFSSCRQTYFWHFSSSLKKSKIKRQTSKKVVLKEREIENYRVVTGKFCSWKKTKLHSSVFSTIHLMSPLNLYLSRCLMRTFLSFKHHSS